MWLIPAHGLHWNLVDSFRIAIVLHWHFLVHLALQEGKRASPLLRSSAATAGCGDKLYNKRRAPAGLSILTLEQSERGFCCLSPEGSLILAVLKTLPLSHKHLCWAEASMNGSADSGLPSAAQPHQEYYEGMEKAGGCRAWNIPNLKCAALFHSHSVQASWYFIWSHTFLLQGPGLIQ